MKKIKLFFLRNKDRLFRFLMVFMSCIFLSFSCFGVTSFASSVYNMTFSQPQLDEYSGYLEIDTTKWGPCVVWFRAFKEDGSSFSSSVQFGAMVSNNVLSISVDYPDTSYQLWVTGFVVNSAGDIVNLTIGQYYASISTNNMGNISNVNAYNCSIGSGLSHSSDMTFIYGADTVISQKIDVVNNILNSIDEHTSVSAYYLEHIFNQIYSLNGNISITNNNLENLYVLIDGKISTTNKYLENLYVLIEREGNLTREKLDMIIQYLEAAENGAYYNPANDGTTSTVINQQQKDEQVIQGTATGRTEANNTISGLSGLLTTTGAVFKGSVAMTKVFNLFAQSSYLAPILQISLVLGISSFVLGSAFIVVGRIRNKKE